jgi:branched-chain amino acid transport system permease protein
MASMGVWITFSLGLVNIGQAAFCSIGAYTTAVLCLRFSWSFWFALPISGLMAALIGVLIGIAILRLKGVYFAMITLCLGEAVRLFFMNSGKLTGGMAGLWNVPRPDAVSIFGLTIIPAFKPESYLSYYYLTAFLMMIVLLITWQLFNSRLGKLFKATKQSDTLASSIGINTAKYRVIAFSVSCFFGGVAGSVLVAYMTNINPAYFTIWDSVHYLLYCVLGGLGYMFGPVVGTFVLSGSFEVLRSIQNYQGILYASIMIVAILWVPDGILSLGVNLKNKFRKTETSLSK